MSPSLARILSVSAVCALMAAPLFISPFSVTLLNYIGIYSLVVLGVILLSGIGGMLSFGQAAFVGIAAYASAWVSALQGQSPWLGLILGLAIVAVVALVVGAVTLRLSGHFLSLGTIAWGLTAYYLFGNIDGLGHHTGIAEIPPISIGPVSFAASHRIFYLIWPSLLIGMFLSHNLLNSRQGRALRALRGGALLVESCGVNEYWIKLAIFILAALLAALSGWFYAHMIRFVAPSAFDVKLSIDYILMAVVGGMQFLLGSIVGSSVVILLKDNIQNYLPLISKSGGQLDTVAFAILYILLLQHARGGALPVFARFFPVQNDPERRDAAPMARRRQPENRNAAPASRSGYAPVRRPDSRQQCHVRIACRRDHWACGPNGAGKTTLFNLVTGTLPADSGTITFCNQDITGWSQRRIAKIGVRTHFPARQNPAEYDFARQCSSWDLFTHQERIFHRCVST